MVHRAITIPELIQLIVSEIPLDHGESWSRSDFPTLVALALTCRAFREPALDIIWSRQDSGRFEQSRRVFTGRLVENPR